MQRVATGWEAKLCIAVDLLLVLDALFPLLSEFYATQCGTRLRLAQEVFGGSWDALISGRTDLVIGAPSDGPPGGGYMARALGNMDLVFVVAPQHPLATAEEPVREDDILQYRAIAVADTSRHLAPRTAGLLSGQAVLTLPNLRAKRYPLRAGLGVGHLPRWLVAEDVAAGRLLVKRLEGHVAPVPLSLAWRSDHQGKALQWFVDSAFNTTTRSRLLGAGNL